MKKLELEAKVRELEAVVKVLQETIAMRYAPNTDYHRPMTEPYHQLPPITTWANNITRIND